MSRVTVSVAELTSIGWSQTDETYSLCAGDTLAILGRSHVDLPPIQLDRVDGTARLDKEIDRGGVLYSPLSKGWTG